VRIGPGRLCLPLLAVAALGALRVPAQTVTATPAAIAFGNQVVGTTSSVHKVTLKNGQTSAITVTSIKTGLADYAQTSDCPVSPSTLAAAATCTISLTFTPAGLGARSDTLTIVDSGTSSPQKVALTGTGTAPTLVSIAITPATASVIAGHSQQFTATGTYSNGTTQNLTSSATWSSSNVAFATVSAGLATGIAQGTATIKAKSGTITGSATLTITAPLLVSISVTPAAPSVALGKTQQFAAIGTYSNGTTQNLSSTAIWSSSAPGVAKVSSSGLATSVAQGSTTITATSGTISGSTTLTVTPAVLTSIAVTPKTSAIAKGRSQQFTATGTYSDGTKQTLTATVTWSSSATNIATIKSGGLAAGVAQGTTTIAAASGSISGSTTLTVTAPVLASIAVTPSSSSIALGRTQQFAATGTYSDNSTQDLTSSATWSSSAAGIATVSGGLASSVAKGTTTIKATSATIIGSATLTVTPAVLTAISVSPSAASIAAGNSQQFAATGTYSDGTKQILTSSVTWSSSDTSVATTDSGGLAVSAAQGATSIAATSGPISGSAALTVTAPVLTSISVNPSTSSVAAGRTQQFTATGTYSDNSTQDLTSSAAWSSSNVGVATVSAGLATGTVMGTTTIKATSSAIIGSATLTVTPAVLTAISVSPSAASIAAGTSQQFTATGTYSDGSTQDLTQTSNWNSSASGVASVSPAGLAAGLAQGSSTITAAIGAVSGSAALTVGPPSLVSIAVTPANPSFAAGTTQPLQATGTYTDGSTLDLTAAVTWSPGNSSVAKVNVHGVATGVAVGNTTVTATSGGISGATTLTVTPATLVSLAITPAIPAIPLGTMQQFAATGTFTDGSTQDVTATVQWSSDNAAIATISNSGSTRGLAKGVATGTANITATSGSVTGTTTLTVSAAALVSIQVTPDSPSIALGTTQPFAAIGTFTDGSTQDLTAQATWSSDATSVATVDKTGLARSVSLGTANVSAASGSITGSTALTVTAAQLVSIAISPDTASIALGLGQPFTATGTYTDGSTQDLTQTGHWSSTAATVATISNSNPTAGLATSLATGTTSIGISSGTVSASATLTVTPAALASININPLNPAIPLGTNQQFTASGSYTDGSTQDVTSAATWSSSSAQVAIISNATGSNGMATSSGTGSVTVTATVGSISAATTLVVNTPALVSISVTPVNGAIPQGTTQQFTATGAYTDGSTQDLTASASWSSDTPSVANISSSGLASGLGVGSANITATSGTISNSASLTVNPPVLVSLSVVPAWATVPAGLGQQYVAIGVYTDGSAQILTGSVTWTSSTPSVATVGSSGIATTVVQGSANIVATLGAIHAAGALTVAAPVLSSIAVSPPNASIPAGTTQKFGAAGTFSDGSTQDITSTAQWTSSSPAASVDDSGLATGVGIGSAAISARVNSISGSAALSVAQPLLVSIALTPASPRLPLGTVLPVKATGTYTDGSTQDLTPAVSWSTGDSGILIMDNQGNATTVAVGNTTVAAAYNGIFGSTAASVTPAALVSIAITPATATIPLGTTQQFTATGAFTDGSTQDVTQTVQWASDSSDATFSSTTNGLATGAITGVANVSATSGSVSASTQLTVTGAVLVSIAVAPANPSIALGTTQQYVAMGTFTDGTTQDLSATATWASDSPSTVTMNAAGLATSVSTGTANISATSGNVSGSTGMIVTGAVLVSIAITPASTSIPLGTTQQFTATGTFTDGTTQDLTQSAHWSSTDADAATISNSAPTDGLATTLATGTTTIQVTSGTVTSSATLVVNAAKLQSIAISPQSPTIALGTTQQFAATGTYTDGTTQDVTSVATWSASDSKVAIVSNSPGSYGLATSSGLGSTTIIAAFNSVSDSTSISVGQAIISSISVMPGAISVPLGYGEQFSATATYSDDSTQDITASAIWASSAPGVGSVNSSGYAASVSQGTATISASSGSVTGSAVMSVLAPVPTALVITPASASVFLGAPQQYTATLIYSNGASVDATSSVTWGTSVPTVATVNSTGIATGVATGSTTVGATWGSNILSGSASLTVLPPATRGWPAFGIDLNTISPFPGTNGAPGPGRFGGVRLWDTPGATWPFIETANNVFNFATVDSILANAFTNNVLYGQAVLARTPYFATSSAHYTDATKCNYYVAKGNLTNQAPGQCDPPSDLNADGTGADLYWRNWVAAFAAHVNAAGYSSSHARINIWEIWNESDMSASWSTRYGTYDQLIRMEQDAYCIIKGGSFAVSATGESCTTVRASVTSVALAGPIDPSATVVMPSYHTNSPYFQMAQNFLYCNASPASSCHNGGAAQTDAINFHMKPGNNQPVAMENVMSAWTASIAGILQSPELAKPLYNTEGGYAIGGWNCATSPGFCYTDSNMQASYVARFLIYSYSIGIANNVWYDWSTSINGLGSANANTAYNQAYGWMVGSSFGSCSENGTVWTCTMTLPNGVAAAAVWDTSQTCTPCTTANQTVGSQYLSYQGLLTGNTKTSIVGNTVPVGIQPILLQVQ